MKASVPLATSVLAGVLSAGVLVAASLAGATEPGAVQIIAAAEVHRGEGVVTKLDQAKGKVTLRHEPIPTLEWPAMQMLFGVSDAGLLRGLKVGDRVRFVLQKTTDDRFIITEVHPK